MMRQVDDWVRYADFYRKSPYSIFPQEHRDSPGRLNFHMITVEQGDHEFVDPSVPETVVALPLSASPDNTWAWDMGNGWHSDAAAPGRMLVLPADNTSRWKVTGTRRLLLLTIPSPTVRRILGPAAPDRLTEAFLPLAESTWEDSFLPHLMMRLWDGTARGHITDRLLVDGALTTLVAHLLQLAGSRDRPMKYVSLPNWRLKRIFEYVESNLHEEIDIVALAEVAGLSVRHFARAFSEEVGETPHRWLMGQRTERAIQLLRADEMPLSEIATACGFSSQSHFTKVFRQITGETPKRWFNATKMG
ncbi:helix-turn-helix transcriptional regulator [Paraburkholderia sp. Tr-20389]|uniref:AraC family transcriptional regulator n=1 Tax=Paraburkholderia sp. Tr-20389 TaxID=2703903 RepID=UPI00197DA128|nr:AraC family transcriptional regulator [Paraburkholderia sp. Tr-20389]MBN3754339.1 helix-turn-helix transcriptional regulator [Paraburkholderia sp. Tr-20389]